MVVRRWMLVGSFVLLACGEADAIADAVVADDCGRPGPVQILPLEREEVVDETWIPVQYGDRYLFGIRTFDHPISNVVYTKFDAAQRGYAEVGARIESIDRCGDDRRVVAEGVDTVVAPRTELEPWLALRRETRTLYWFDPDGAFAPRELSPVPSSYGWMVTDDVVHVFRPDTHDLVRFTLRGDAPIRETVIDRVSAVGPMSALRSVDAPSLLFALRDDGELLSLDTRTRRLVSTARGVGGIVTDRDPRFVVWWPGDSSALLPQPIIEATAVDASRGRSLALALGDDAPLAFAMQGPVLATMYYGPDPRLPTRTEVVRTRLTFLPDMSSILVDGEWEVHGISVGNRFTARSPLAVRGDRAFASASYVFESGPDGVHIVGGPFAGNAYADGLWSSDCDDDELVAGTRPCDVIHMPLDTLEPEVIAEQAWSGIALPDDRWLLFSAPTPPPDAARPDSRGTLLVLDGSTRDVSSLARDVSPSYQNLQPHELVDSIWHTNEIVYQVRALSGDRTGLWRARFE